MDGDDNASPMADEQTHPEPVLDEAAKSSSTEPCPYDDSHMLEFYRALTHMMHSRRFPVHHRRPLQHGHGGGYVPVMVGILRDGIWYVNGEAVADDDAYIDGGFGGVAASEEAIAALPETTVQDEEEIMGEKECAVCLRAYETGDTVRTMPCSHGFHEHCIFQWLRVSRLCPFCRFALPAAESFVDDDDDNEGNSEEEDDGEEDDHVERN